MRTNPNLLALLLLGLVFTFPACSGGGVSGSDAGSVDDVALGLEVATTVGSLKGDYADDSRDVVAFRGVPYAQPPVGNSRWRPGMGFAQRLRLDRPAGNDLGSIRLCIREGILLPARIVCISISGRRQVSLRTRCP